ncbi:MAG: SdpI family protein [Bacteroidota bacterium]
MNIKEILKKEWFILVILLIPFGVSAYLWNDLPDIVPTHFNAKGEADDWGPKWVNALMLPGIGLGTYLLMVFLPAIDPKKRITSNQKAIAAIRVITSLFIVAVYGIVIRISLGHSFSFQGYVPVGVGILFIVIGNYINSVKPNYFIGIRTPWTLENETVWKKTHRLGSKLWIIGGLLLLLSPFLPLMNHNTTFLSIVFIMVAIPFIYSFIAFKNLSS